MKNALLVTALLSSVLGAGMAEAKPYGLSKIDRHYISVGVDYLDMEVDRFKASSSTPSITLGYGYRLNRYFELGTSVSVKTSDDITAEFVDTYAVADHSSGEPALGTPMTTTYTNNLNSSVLAGLHMKVVLPVSDNFDVYATVGGTYGRIEHDGYANVDGRIIDHPNHASTTEEYVNGIENGQSECYLTGVESACGAGVEVYNEVFNSVSLSYGAGVRWLFRDSGSVHIINMGANSLFRKDDFNVLAYGVNYEFQF